MGKKHFVLMADVLRSRNSDPNQFLPMLKEITTSINNKYAQHVVSPLTITLGDEFQGIIGDLKHLVNIMVEIEESMLNLHPHLQLRFSARYDEISSPINKKIAYEMYGPALTIAREELQILKKSTSRFHIHTGQEERDHYINKLFIIFQMLSDQWSPKHYPAIHDYLRGKQDYKELVEKGHYQNESGAWKMVKSQNLEEYLVVKDLILRTTEWNDN